MDPNETLRRLREMVKAILADKYDQNTLFDLAELVDALDGWLSSGGFPPDAWSPIKVQPDQNDFRITLFNEIVRVWHLSSRGRKTKLEATGKACEEVGELMQAVLCETGAHLCDYKGLDETHVAKETADVVQCAVSVAQVYGLTVEDWFKVLAKENDKWENRLNEYEREDRAQITGG